MTLELRSNEKTSLCPERLTISARGGTERADGEMESGIMKNVCIDVRTRREVPAPRGLQSAEGREMAVRQ